ncbi:MAG TPA: 3-oxoacyl-[acyl-carrier-protein] synthase III C-terminal domain-containing protein [Kofleriaceae bacterium]|nr:3-oxoacyl-[acyl-carrier-protein] synthase III C-terminal domain-containing protein [Kofleriaceae bacterium]
MTSLGGGHVFGRGALHLADAAARACLERARHPADELDLLVHVGVYKDFEIAEPALASIIQEDIDANLGSPPRLGHHGTFSFDVSNGGCGVITAAQLVDSFVADGGARRGMIVAADADPSPHTTQDFPFAPAGGALLISHVDDEGGFERFDTRTFPEHAGQFETQLRWEPHAGRTHRGRNVLELFEAPAFAATCIEAGTLVARELLAATETPAGSIDLLIASQYPPTFARELGRALGIADDRVPRVAPELARTHTAGPIAALEAAIASHRFAVARRVLFVTCGAGLTIGAALFRTPPATSFFAG